MKTLLMGGQACVLYGAAEFSRDLDLLILAGRDNLASLQSALDDLQAGPIRVPPFEADTSCGGTPFIFVAVART